MSQIERLLNFAILFLRLQLATKMFTTLRSSAGSNAVMARYNVLLHAMRAQAGYIMTMIAANSGIVILVSM